MIKFEKKDNKMKLYLVKVEMYDYTQEGIKFFDPDSKCNVYREFKQARQAGVKDLQTRIKAIEEGANCSFSKMLKKEQVDYDFQIIQIDNLAYAEKFDTKYDEFDEDSICKLEPTHKVYSLDYEGNILYVNYEYRYQNALWDTQKRIKLYPEDLEKGASEKFKIGDIVKLKHEIDYGYIDDNVDRIYVVRWLPRKFNGEKYFENTYALVSLYEMKNEWGNKELFTYEYFGHDIEKYTGVIEKDSEYNLLSKIVKGDICVSYEYWTKIKIGMLPLTKETLRKENGEEGDDWGFYSTEIGPKRTGLNVSVFPKKNIFGENIKECLPKIRIQNERNNYEDTFSITLEEEPKVVIGENKLSKEDYQKVCEFVRKNLEILKKHFDPNNEFDDDELWEALKENGSIQI